ncbi:hypothetical protein PVAP13_5NG577860 [Panicum virgatum]|uniref:Uncharacterized protein n=1 Tax=Panicum virgatum TaxID=38727 RepID=A0A8T0S6E2_PANVG|nr:hypothetical protein PVAP13_5NG577860 [Panicum virgatum]
MLPLPLRAARHRASARRGGGEWRGRGERATTSSFGLGLLVVPPMSSAAGHLRPQRPPSDLLALTGHGHGGCAGRGMDKWRATAAGWASIGGGARFLCSPAPGRRAEEWRVGPDGAGERVEAAESGGHVASPSSSTTSISLAPSSSISISTSSIPIPGISAPNRTRSPRINTTIARVARGGGRRRGKGRICSPHRRCGRAAPRSTAWRRRGARSSVASPWLDLIPHYPWSELLHASSVFSQAPSPSPLLELVVSSTRFRLEQHEQQHHHQPEPRLCLPRDDFDPGPSRFPPREGNFLAPYAVGSDEAPELAHAPARPRLGSREPPEGERGNICLGGERRRSFASRQSNTTTSLPASTHDTHQQHPFHPGPRRQPPSTVHRRALPPPQESMRHVSLPAYLTRPPPPSPISHPTFLIRRRTDARARTSTALPVREGKRNWRAVSHSLPTRYLAGGWGRHAGRRSRIRRPGRRRQVDRCGCAAPQRL